MLPAKKRVTTPRKKSADEALSSLMRLCARAEKSSGDALRLMTRWGVESADRQKVLQRLIADRFIDDRRYAAAFIREKTNLSSWGEYKIRTSLRSKGVTEEIINEALAESEGVNNIERLQERLSRKIRSIKAETPYSLKTKLIRYGLSLGFPMDAVIESAEQILKSQNIDTECDTQDTF